MKWLLEMAFRNIRRNRRRTALALSSIALSVMLMTFMGGFVDGVLKNMVKNLTKNESGHVRIVSKGFEERERFMPVDELITDPEAVADAIRAIPELRGKVTAVAERILFGTLLSNGPNTKVAFGISGDPAVEADLLRLAPSVVRGRYIAGPGEAILGEKLAADLGLAVGDSLRVVATGADYGLHLKRFAVVGVFRTGLNQLDGGAFQIPVADAKDFLRTEGGVQRMLVMLRDYRDAGIAAALIAAAVSVLPGGGDLVVRPWTDIGEYPRLIGVMETIYGWIFVVIAFLGAFIVSNIMMMVVLERRKEIGILKALGLRRRWILALFVSEGAALGALGSAAGALVGHGLCVWFSIHGIDFSSAFGSINFPVDPVYYTSADPLSALKMFAIGLAVATVVSIPPSRRGATMNAVDAIKSVA
ncbi:MAG TPA: hypothetical protein DIC34_09235 [Treponema sp.]|nr:MAG: hypothetical protein A2Y36_16525 [Treponema sp. GWA1_62_8]OHE64454.1 MAG: hypothetical protein A2001_02210 [Treponema sp. GWC1_61_84]OHE70708.1 MAG: hypothetical protein A2413_20880 [Treponema sp. RIFOXYC1_FULL_61_9]HCM26710.1 hypothetical protein [Treponema sp.]